MANLQLGNQQYDELMGGCGYNPICYGKKIVVSTKDVVEGGLKIVVAPIKGGTHAILEVGRGIKEGDIGKVLKAPFKGAGHTFMETFRGTTKIALSPFDIVTDFFEIFTGDKKKKASKKSAGGFTLIEDEEEGRFPVVPVALAAAAAVGGYFMLKG